MKFSRYQITVVALLAFLQFTVVLDFMILSPLGALLLKELAIAPARFGLVVSAYAFSAGASGLVAAGFADKFDRKKLLLFFYSGFVVGTVLCGIAPSYAFLMMGRMVAGLFGGVIGSISFAIIADLFPFEVRGRVMGVVMTAFAASQVLGIPVGLYLSNAYGWHAPFLMIAAVSSAVGVIIFTQLRPVDDHLKQPSDRNAFRHIVATLTRPRYQWGFASTMLLAIGGFMLMPFGSAFSVHNLGIPLKKLPLLYMGTGIASIAAGPLLGRLSDRVGKYATFVGGSAVALVVVVYYTHLGVTPLSVAIALNIVLFVAITARMISAQALASAIPEARDRGAYMSISSSLQQLAGGVASSAAGLIVTQTAEGPLEHYDRLGYVVCTAMAATVVLMYRINQMVTGASSGVPTPLAAAAAHAESEQAS
ncbi:MAG: MFS transporter [Polyangiaceae bacterium]|jgi:predicted MFS family arabinose efflux permease